MSETLTYTILTTEFNDNSITAAEAEAVIMSAIRLLNTYGASITQLSGTEGSRTGTYTSAEMGAIMAMSREIYSNHYTNADGSTSTQLGPAGVSYGTSTRLLGFARNLAFQLKGRTFLRT